MSERCDRCDRPDCKLPGARAAYAAISKQLADSLHRVTDEEDAIVKAYYHACGNCAAHAVDWRARAHAAEAALESMRGVLDSDLNLFEGIDELRRIVDEWSKR